LAEVSGQIRRKKLSEDLAQAIRTAREGFPVPELTAAYWNEAADKLRENEEAARFICRGIMRQNRRGFANRIWRLRWRRLRGGRDAFYKGEIAKKLLAGMKRHGGTMVEEDLAKFSSEWVEPISTTYRDWTVYELPPNGQGCRTGNAEHHGDISARAKRI